MRAIQPEKSKSCQIIGINGSTVVKIAIKAAARLLLVTSEYRKINKIDYFIAVQIRVRIGLRKTFNSIGNRDHGQNNNSR